MTDLHKRFAFDLHDKAALDENAFSVARARFGTNTEEQDRMLYQAILMYQSALATPAPLSDEPVAWQYFDSFGKWTHVDAAQLDWHRNRGFEVRPLYAAPLATPSDKQEAVGAVPGGNGYPDAMVIKNDPCAHCGGRGCFSCLRNAPLAQSAEQDRIDAERWRYARQLQRRPDEYDAYIDRQRAKGASK
jgi:hypothetical protein